EGERRGPRGAAVAPRVGAGRGAGRRRSRCQREWLEVKYRLLVIGMAIVTLAAQASLRSVDVTGLDDGLGTRRLMIVVEGSVDSMVLTDPRGRIDDGTPNEEGFVKSDIPGCSRVSGVEEIDEGSGTSGPPTTE